MNLTFNSSGKIWNCSLNLPFLHPHATISSNNSNTTTSVRIRLVDSTVRNDLCHPSFDSNVKYESNSITASSSRQYHTGILIFGSIRTVIRKRSPCLPHKRDRWPATVWKQYGSVVRGGLWGGCGQIIRRFLGTFEHYLFYGTYFLGMLVRLAKNAALFQKFTLHLIGFCVCD